jgi:hypothetical protein
VRDRPPHRTYDGPMRDTELFSFAVCDIPSGYTEYKAPSDVDAGAPPEAGFDGGGGDGGFESGADGSATDAG